MCYCNIIYAAAQHFANNFLPKLPNKYIMAKKYLVVLQHLDPYFSIAERENLNWIPDAQVTWDLDQVQADSRFKIFIIPVFNPGGVLPFTDDCSWADLVIGVTSEMLNGHYPTFFEQITSKINNQNIIFIAGGNGLSSPDRSRFYGPSLRWVNHIFDNHRDYVHSSIPTAKPYLFDALLGHAHHHRRYILYKLMEDNLLDKSLVSTWVRQDFTDPDFDQKCLNRELHSHIQYGDLVRKYGLINFYRSPGLDELESVDVIPPKADSVNYTSVYPTSKNCKVMPKELLPMSMDLPTKIFDSSWYSIVGETSHQNNQVFITEKTAKPIIAKRVFVLFAAQGCLEFLRSHGFQTFDGIIDESYDSIEDDQLRWNAACKQMSWLLTQNPQEILAKVKPRVDHNFAVMMERGWLLDYVEDLELRVQGLVGQT